MQQGLHLPRRDEAEILPAKLRDYVLNPEHSSGRHKARVFASALGIYQEDWEYLRNEILAGMDSSTVSAVRQPGPWGLSYEVRMPIDGLNGKTHIVIAGWQVDAPDGAPRLDGLRGCPVATRTRLTTIRRAWEGATKRSGSRSRETIVADLLDVIELRVPSGHWPAGTTGTVVEVFDDGVLVEIADDHGRTLDLLALPHAAVSTLRSPEQQRLPA